MPTGNTIVKVHKNWKNMDAQRASFEEDGKKVSRDNSAEKNPVVYDRILLSQPKSKHWIP